MAELNLRQDLDNAFIILQEAKSLMLPDAHIVVASLEAIRSSKVLLAKVLVAGMPPQPKLP